MRTESHVAGFALLAQWVGRHPPPKESGTAGGRCERSTRRSPAHDLAVSSDLGFDVGELDLRFGDFCARGLELRESLLPKRLVFQRALKLQRDRAP